MDGQDEQVTQRNPVASRTFADISREDPYSTLNTDAASQAPNMRVRFYRRFVYCIDLVKLHLARSCSPCGRAEINSQQQNSASEKLLATPHPDEDRSETSLSDLQPQDEAEDPPIVCLRPDKDIECLQPDKDIMRGETQLTSQKFPNGMYPITTDDRFAEYAELSENALQIGRSVFLPLAQEKSLPGTSADHQEKNARSKFLINTPRALGFIGKGDKDISRLLHMLLIPKPRSTAIVSLPGQGNSNSDNDNDNETFIPWVFALTPDDLDILYEMRELGLNFLRQEKNMQWFYQRYAHLDVETDLLGFALREWLSPDHIQFGFHIRPTVGYLHMHMLVGPLTEFGADYEERELEVRVDSQSTPKLAAKVSLDRKGYLPGTTAFVTVTDVVDLVNGVRPLEGVKVRSRLLVGGRAPWTSQWLPLGPEGKRVFAISLPNMTTTRSTTISVEAVFGFSSRTFVLPVPMLNKARVNFFPSTGVLVQGVRNTVFFEARSARTGEPLDLTGARLVSLRDGFLIPEDPHSIDLVHAKLRAGHEGRGSFDFIVEEDTSYALELPDANLRFPLPAAEMNLTLHLQSRSGTAVYDAGETIKVHLRASPGFRTTHGISIFLLKNQLILSSQQVREDVADHLSDEVELRPHANISGVLRIVARDGTKVLAERLVFVHPAREINVAIDVQQTIDPSRANRPTTKAKLTIVTNAPARLAISVVPLSRILQYPRRRWPPSLRESVFLENEVDEFLSVKDYLGEDHQPLDLLLGVQGWRKFLDDPRILETRWKRRHDAKEALRLARVLGIPSECRPKPTIRHFFARGDVDMHLARFVRVPAADGHPDVAFALAPNIALQAQAKQDTTEDADEHVHELENDDHSTTIFFQTGVQTIKQRESDAHAASLQVKVPHSGTYLVRVDAWDESGAFGQNSTEFVTTEALVLDVPVPPHARVGDTLSIRAEIRAQPFEDVLVGLTLNANHNDYSLRADEFGRASVTESLHVTKAQDLSLQIQAQGKTSRAIKQISRSIRILEAGWVQQWTHGGLISGDMFESRTTVHLPAHVLKGGSVSWKLQYFPTQASSMTSSDNGEDNVYHMIRNATLKLVRGYQRLLTFETSTAGFDWFGKSPGHEALSAYGIVQFAEMMRLSTDFEDLVDKQMLKRTVSWLLSRRDDAGGFKRSSRALDSFGRASALTTDMYIMWALVRSRAIPISALQPELHLLNEQLSSTKDPYVLALAVSALHRCAEETPNQKWDFDGIEDAYVRLASFQNASTGCLDHRIGMTITTPTHASAHHLTEHEPLMLKNDFAPPDGASRSVVFKASTPSLKSSRTSVNVDPAKPSVDKSGPLSIPYLITASYRIEHPASHDACALRLRLSASAEGTAAEADSSSDEEVPLRVEIGSTVVKTWTLENRWDESVSMPIARIGYEVSLEPDMESLRHLVTSSDTGIDMFEIQDGFVTLYWRGLGPREKQDFQLTFVARFAGQFTAQSSEAYLYYKDEHRVYTHATQLDVIATTGDMGTRLDSSAGKLLQSYKVMDKDRRSDWASPETFGEDYPSLLSRHTHFPEDVGSGTDQSMLCFSTSSIRWKQNPIDFCTKGVAAKAMRLRRLGMRKVSLETPTHGLAIGTMTHRVRQTSHLQGAEEIRHIFKMQMLENTGNGRLIRTASSSSTMVTITDPM
ncbi:CD109 antigen [Hondaea fermentalgiana]|uniref:CD109 antigen n=1 Tax=Hondaea fermentalgiana TaxID=2315210 RepID=A0A2R5GMG4_9STRA|nr:CD109 antigen [Hondaea fermentalgiana]|eukprot:GBG32070.1 CD109 antigen [Hondaea fermentalgiana]